MVGVLQWVKGQWPPEPSRGVKCQVVLEEDEMGPDTSARGEGGSFITRLVILWTAAVFLLCARPCWRCGDAAVNQTAREERGVESWR